MTYGVITVSRVTAGEFMGLRPIVTRIITFINFEFEAGLSSALARSPRRSLYIISRGRIGTAILYIWVACPENSLWLQPHWVYTKIEKRLKVGKYHHDGKKHINNIN